MDIYHYAQNLWKANKKINWSDKSFSIEKAFICSFFSKLVYEHLPEFELKQKSRVHIIPSEIYQQHFVNKTTSNIRELFRIIDLPDIFIIETELAIVVGMNSRQYTIVAIRGTKKAADWLVNLNVFKEFHKKGNGLKFHRGFYKAISVCYNEIIKKIKSSKYNDVPVYVTGHSLGGAMAAIMHSEFANNNDPLLITTNSCYTFGMPRYANKNVINRLSTPFHFLNSKDIVPTIPPKWLGYENPHDENVLDGNRINKATNRSSISFFKWATRLVTVKGIRDHSIELYTDRLLSLI